MTIFFIFAAIQWLICGHCHSHDYCSSWQNFSHSSKTGPTNQTLKTEALLPSLQLASKGKYNHWVNLAYNHHICRQWNFFSHWTGSQAVERWARRLPTMSGELIISKIPPVSYLLRVYKEGVGLKQSFQFSRSYSALSGFCSITEGDYSWFFNVMPLSKYNSFVLLHLFC